MICGLGGLRSKLAKAAGAEPAGQMRNEELHAAAARSTFSSQNVKNTPFSDHFSKFQCTALWREAHFEVKLYKTHHSRTTLGSSDVEKIAHRCGAKHMSKSKCQKK